MLKAKIASFCLQIPFSIHCTEMYGNNLFTEPKALMTCDHIHAKGFFYSSLKRKINLSFTYITRRYISFDIKLTAVIRNYIWKPQYFPPQTKNNLSEIDILLN